MENRGNRQVICRYCGGANRAQAKFCAHCGQALGLAWVDPIQSEPAGRQTDRSDYVALGSSVVAVISTLMFVLIFSMAFPIYSLSGSMLNSRLYAHALESQDVYDRFPELFGQQMAFWIQELKSDVFLMELFFPNIQQSDWELIAERVITREWAQAQTENMLDQVFDYAHLDRSPLTLIVSFVDVKERLGGQVGYDAYLEITNAKPDCNMMELAQWLVAPMIEMLPICKLPKEANFFGFSAPDPQEVAPRILADWAATLPDETNLADSLDDLSRQEIDDLFKAIRLAHTVSAIFIGLAILFLLLTLISPKARQLKSWLRYWGIPLLVTGGLVLLAAILMTVFSIWQANQLIESLATVFVPDAVELGKDIGREVILRFALPIALVGGALALAGFGMAGISFFIGGGKPFSYPAGSYD